MNQRTSALLGTVIRYAQNPATKAPVRTNGELRPFDYSSQEFAADRTWLAPDGQPLAAPGFNCGEVAYALRRYCAGTPMKEALQLISMDGFSPATHNDLIFYGRAFYGHLVANSISIVAPGSMCETDEGCMAYAAVTSFCGDLLLGVSPVQEVVPEDAQLLCVAKSPLPLEP